MGKLDLIQFFVLLVASCIPIVSAAGELNVTFYSKEHNKALKGIIRQLITDYHKLGLANGKISNELAAIGGFQNLPALNNGLSPAPLGFVSPSNDGNQKSFPSDQALNVPTLQNFTTAQGTVPMDGGFTLWTTWSKCPVSCGRTALRSRERYCTNPAPVNGGKNCEGPRFQLKLCKMKECPGSHFSAWTSWGACGNKCGKGVKHRYRHCTSPSPIGKACSGRRKEVAKCVGKMCNDQNSIVDIDPQTVCGYDPCTVAKCIAMPYATCVSDFKCRPVFFDAEERRVNDCKGTQLYLTINPDSVCRFNPCKYTTCMTATPAKCVVNTKCHPVFLDAFGKRMDCRGVFKVPARYICGHNPCSSAMCKAQPSARCLVDHECKPIFVNAVKNMYKQCSERGQIVKGHDNDEESDEDDPLRKLMKGKHVKNKDNTDDDNDDDEETREEMAHAKDDGEVENMAEKKAKIPARFTERNDKNN